VPLSASQNDSWEYVLSRKKCFSCEIAVVTSVQNLGASTFQVLCGADGEFGLHGFKCAAPNRQISAKLEPWMARFVSTVICVKLQIFYIQEVAWYCIKLLIFYRQEVARSIFWLPCNCYRLWATKLVWDHCIIAYRSACDGGRTSTMRTPTSSYVRGRTTDGTSEAICH
jgi:hypothetical protein